jgi:hypothetical protein
MSDFICYLRAVLWQTQGFPHDAQIRLLGVVLLEAITSKLYPLRVNKDTERSCLLMIEDMS